MQNVNSQTSKYIFIYFNINDDFISRNPVSYPLLLATGMIMNEKETQRNILDTRSGTQWLEARTCTTCRVKPREGRL